MLILAKTMPIDEVAKMEVVEGVFFAKGPPIFSKRLEIRFSHPLLPKGLPKGPCPWSHGTMPETK